MTDSKLGAQYLEVLKFKGIYGSSYTMLVEILISIRT